MPKTDNPHSVRLYESIAKHTDEQTAERIAHRIPLSKSADINKKFTWAQNICTHLQNEFDDATVKKIRMDCACGPETGKTNNLKRLYQSSTDLDDFTEKANKLNQGFEIQRRGNDLLMIYPQCYCSCVKRINEPISIIWCYCTLGYTKRMFSHILDRDVDVELLESVKTGSNRCVILVRC